MNLGDSYNGGIIEVKIGDHTIGVRYPDLSFKWIELQITEERVIDETNTGI